MVCGVEELRVAVDTGTGSDPVRQFLGFPLPESLALPECYRRVISQRAKPLSNVKDLAQGWFIGNNFLVFHHQE